MFMILCCSSEERKESAKIVAVDLQTMAPIDGVIQLQGDITKVGSQALISWWCLREIILVGG